MNYDPRIHHRRSIRLRGYDYSRAGAYFITICTYNNKHRFGNIVPMSHVGAGQPKHIIRNEGSFKRISYYIINNPGKWMKKKIL